MQLKALKALLAGVILTLPLFAYANNQKPAKHIDVFTTSDSVNRLQINRLKQLTNMEVNIHYVDAVGNFQRYLGGKINVGHKVTKQDISNVRLQLQKKLTSKQIESEKKKLQAGLRTYQKAKALGVEKIPAIVFEDRYVVYGSDAVKATKIYYQKVGQQ